MNTLMSSALVALSLVVATPCLAQTTAFSFARGEAWHRGDVWRLAQLNFRTIANNFDLTVPDATTRQPIAPRYAPDVDHDLVAPEIVCIAGVICYENHGRPVHW